MRRMLLLVALLAGCGSDSDEARGPALPNGETCPPGAELEERDGEILAGPATFYICRDDAGERYGYQVTATDDGQIWTVACTDADGEVILQLGYDASARLVTGFCLGPEPPNEYRFYPQRGDTDLDRSECYPCP